MLHVSPQLAFARLEVLRVLASHEFWVQLNLPRDTAGAAALWDPGQARLPSSVLERNGALDDSDSVSLAEGSYAAVSALAPGLVQHHFLSGILLHEISLALESTNADLRMRALLCLRQILAG
jgi:hypothetical protein